MNNFGLYRPPELREQVSLLLVCPIRPLPEVCTCFFPSPSLWRFLELLFQINLLLCRKYLPDHLWSPSWLH
jgi:hypothetical protein